MCPCAKLASNHCNIVVTIGILCYAVFLQVTQESIVRLYADEYIYLDSIRWIFDVSRFLELPLVSLFLQKLKSELFGCFFL